MTAPTPEGLRDTLTRALARTVYRDDDPAPHILRICEPWADHLMPVVQAALADRHAEIETLRLMYTSACTRAKDDRDDLKWTRGELAKADAESNAAAKRAERAEALAARYRMQIDDPDSLLTRLDEAEAAVQRVRDLAERAKRDAEELFSVQFGGAPGPARLPVDDVLAALDGGGVPEIGDRYRDRHGEEWTVGTNGLMHHHSYSQRGLDELRREYGPLTRIGVPR